MEYTTIKIPSQTHKLIKALAQKASIAQQELLEISLKEYERKLFWEECQQKYEELALSDKFEEYNEDLKLYENTLLDGLDNEY